MYKIKSNIRIRSCGELSFIVNINNNNIYTIKTNTMEFFLQKLNEGIGSNDIIGLYDNSFAKFLLQLEQNDIIGDYD